MKRYEGMFLFDTAIANEWPTVEQEVRRLCDRIDGELQVCVKFDERKLAYEINGRKRGTYVLAYFNAAPERIVDLERDVRLSEMVLRMLVLRADNVSAERIAELKALPAGEPISPTSGDGRRHHDDRGRRTWGSPSETTTRPPTAKEARPSAARAKAPTATEPAPPTEPTPDGPATAEPTAQATTASDATVTERTEEQTG